MLHDKCRPNGVDCKGIGQLMRIEVTPGFLWPLVIVVKIPGRIDHKADIAQGRSSLSRSRQTGLNGQVDWNGTLSGKADHRLEVSRSRQTGKQRRSDTPGRTKHHRDTVRVERLEAKACVLTRGRVCSPHIFPNAWIAGAVPHEPRHLQLNGQASCERGKRERGNNHSG